MCNPKQRDDSAAAEPGDRQTPMAFPAVPDAQYGFRRLLAQRQSELSLQLLVDRTPTWEPASNLDLAHVAEYQALMRNRRRNERSQTEEDNRGAVFFFTQQFYALNINFSL
ncbi:hypothetical protein PR003_g23295 [Phytophthora rubi]|uniref:Uncharacterized protein n=1 Tax=Phytophthora rubi TaxID=129364 RepID=A0A6A4CX03_9STRA|nr:hypothetical protein PR002_g22700 [Phytophthora rubi]KAE8988148.1 hypothetical protein PR001_g22125 [Phytophthora rubi]KAE9298244.1 hypothetical protein PR003_g23295 [Phytophthora rubi]